MPDRNDTTFTLREIITSIRTNLTTTAAHDASKDNENNPAGFARDLQDHLIGAFENAVDDRPARTNWTSEPLRMVEKCATFSLLERQRSDRALVAFAECLHAIDRNVPIDVCAFWGQFHVALGVGRMTWHGPTSAIVPNTAMLRTSILRAGRYLTADGLIPLHEIAETNRIMRAYRRAIHLDDLTRLLSETSHSLTAKDRTNG